MVSDITTRRRLDRQILEDRLDAIRFAYIDASCFLTEMLGREFDGRLGQQMLDLKDIISSGLVLFEASAGGSVALERLDARLHELDPEAVQTASEGVQ